ncbi:MAG TPA: hypothetical protein VHI72_20430 [Hyphomicrobiaceae bacterium]|nr:hypothetical protein [Hyphomicrobiaceae bacterium]
MSTRLNGALQHLRLELDGAKSRSGAALPNIDNKKFELTPCVSWAPNSTICAE